MNSGLAGKDLLTVQLKCGASLPPRVARVKFTQRSKLTTDLRAQNISSWPADETFVWQGTEPEAWSQTSPLQQLPPPWKVMIMSDGSVTRHLHLLTGAPIAVDCLQMADIGQDLAGLPEPAQRMAGSSALVQRQVLLRHMPDREPLVYACSWWKAEEVGHYLKDRSKSIWVSLSSQRMELHRDIQLIFQSQNPQLEKLLEQEGPFWGRQYLFWHDQRPLTMIHEVFSPALNKYLGTPRHN